MDITLVCIILFSVWGSGMTCYQLGRQVGIEEAVNHMQKEGFLDLDE